MSRNIAAVSAYTFVATLTLFAGCTGGGGGGAGDGGTEDPDSASPGSDGATADVITLPTDSATADTAKPLDCSGSKVSDLPACDTCAKAKCCAEIRACETNPDCAALTACLEKCPANDNECALRCQSASPNGAPNLQAVGVCARRECAKECT